MKRLTLWPQLHIGERTVYSDRKGTLAILPRADKPVQITIKELPERKPAGRRRT